MRKYTLILICLISCKKNFESLKTEKIFTKIPAEISGVTFRNDILENEKLHYYKYQYIYIGGGVAAADFNNDGLEDLFFTSNIYHNKLFLNKGNFQFDDITLKAGIKKRPGFDVGVSVIDINNDGYLDIYINRAGWYKGDIKLANMLYINNGDLTFTEQAEKYGLADTGKSITSSFFDYDKDGDLDVYIANAPSDFSLSGKIIDLEKIKNSSKTNTLRGNDKLYNNDGNGYFTDVSKQAGISPDLGFGLHTQVGDLNHDGWQDIYVSNDFISPDFAYINNGDGTFSEQSKKLFKHISYYSMGSDIADINNDGLSDLFVLDMSPEDYIRSKTTMSMMSVDRFQKMIDKGYHHQYMHNVMQLNNGNNTFSEIANMSGIAKTDWSWSALFADFDLDGYNDLYVTNGIYRDVVDRDTNTEINKYINANKSKLKEVDFYNFTQKLPQQKLTNYFFKNKGNTMFSDVSKDWADEKPTFSNGAVYVDLDNDGDLDIVTNNLDENATLLKNNTIENQHKNYLKFKFIGSGKNKFGIGTKVEIFKKNGEILSRQLINSRGYLSSMSNVLHFGLGDLKKIKKAKVTWFDGKVEFFEGLEANQTKTVVYKNAEHYNKKEHQITEHQIFKEYPFQFFHQEISYKDYDKQVLLPHKLSQTGPCIATVDLNNDGLEDVFIGGAHQQAGKLLIGTKNNIFKEINIAEFIKDKKHEDVSACFFDADNDGDQDLYVVSGSYEFLEGSELLEDRLYINHGNFNFKRTNTKIPSIKTAGAVVRASDFDNDGDIDLFIGSRVIPGKYPYAPKSKLLINYKGVFKNEIANKATELETIGMVTDAQWVDIDDDNDIDLVVTGEWMGIEVFENTNGILSKSKKHTQLASTVGWWNKLLIEDIDNDGDLDIVAGNLGLNYKFHASKEKPFHVYTNDFDKNGVEDIMLAKYYKSKQVPVRGKSCTAQQMPFLKKKIKTYNDFANSDLRGLLGKKVESSLHYAANEFRSGIFINNGNNQFNFSAFSLEVQRSPINSIVYQDYDKDGVKDLLMAGNNHLSEVETTRADSGIGVFLKGEIQTGFTYIPNTQTGFYADKDVRALKILKTHNNKSLLVINNNNQHQLYLNIN